MGWSTIRGEAVEFRSCGTTVRGHLGRPAAPGRFPAVIVLHGLPGMLSNIQRAAERFGDEGYVGLAINWQSHEPDPSDADQMSYVADAAAYLQFFKKVELHGEPPDTVVFELVRRDE